MQKLIAKKKDEKMACHSSVINTMIQRLETSTVIYDGAFVVYKRDLIKPALPVFNSKTFNVRVINGAGTADTQYVTPGLAFPQYPSSLSYGARGVVFNWAERFSNTAIIMHGGECFEAASHLLKRPDGLSDESIIKMGEKAEQLELPRDFMTQPGGTFNLLTNPFKDENLKEYVDKIYAELFPEENKDETVLIFIGNKPTLISMAKYHFLGAEDINKYNVIEQGSERSMLADHRLYYGKQSFTVPFTNQHLGYDGSECSARLYPVFHGSNKVAVTENGTLPFSEKNEEFQYKAVKEFMQLFKKMVGKRSEMKTYSPSRFLGCVAASILLEDPVMTAVDVQEDKEDPAMLLNARLDVIYYAVIKQKMVNTNVVVNDSKIFQAAYAGKVEKSSFSPCKSLSYRVNFTEDEPAMKHEEMYVKDAKGNNIRNAFPHKTERATTFHSLMESMKKDLPNVSVEQKELQASMLMCTNNLIQILDEKSLFNADVLESRKEFVERTGAALDNGKNTDIGFMTALRSAPNQISRYIESPYARLLARLNGNIFLFKEVMEMCLVVTRGQMFIEPDTEHPAMSGENPTVCSWEGIPYVAKDNYCFCALMTQTVATLVGEETSQIKMSSLFNTCFPRCSVYEQAEQQRPGNASMQSFAMHFSMRTDDNLGKMSCFGDVTLKNNSDDEHGLMSAEAFERKKDKADKTNAPAEQSASSSKDDEEKEVDYSKVKKCATLYDMVLKSNPTMLKPSHRLDFSNMGVDEVNQLGAAEKLNFKKYEKTVKILNEIEKHSFNGRPMKGGVGSFTLASFNALAATILEDSTSTKDYMIRSLHKDMPMLTVKGTKTETKAVEEVSDQVEMEEDTEEDMVMKAVESQSRKRKLASDNERECKRAKIEGVSDEVKKLSRAIYMYALTSQSGLATKPLTLADVPEEYMKTLQSSQKDVMIYLGYLTSLNESTQSLKPENRTVECVMTKTMNAYVSNIADYIVSVADVIQRECGFENPEVMHDRLYMHTSQVNKKMSKQMFAVVDPNSTGDYIQQITERKLLNVLGKQFKDVKDFTNESCEIDGSEITTAMKHTDAPNVVESVIPIPQNLQKLSVDVETHNEVIEYTADLSNYSSDVSQMKKHGGLPNVNLTTYTIMQLKIKTGTLADDRQEIRFEGRGGRGNNTEKLNNELEKIHNKTKKGGQYTAYPLTCGDYTVDENGFTGAGAKGPLSVPLLSAMHMKNNVRYDRVNKPGFSSTQECQRSSKYISNFVADMVTKYANNESCHFSLFSKQVVGDLSKIHITHKLAQEKLVDVMSTLLRKEGNSEYIKKLKLLYIGGARDSQAVIERMTREYEESAPILHLVFSLGQIYGAKAAVGNSMYNQDLERDQQAATIMTAGILNLLTTKDDNSVTASKFKGKNQGLPTTITCHSNYSMVDNKPVVMCTTGSFVSAGQPRIVMKGGISSYYDVNKKVLRSMRLDRHFLPDTVPAEVVNQDGGIAKIGATLMIKTSAAHFSKSEKVVKEVKPENIMKVGDLDVFCAAITSSAVAKTFYDYICAKLFGGDAPESREVLNKAIVKNYLPHLDDPIQEYAVKSRFTDIIASGVLAEDMDYIMDESEEFDLFDE